MSKIKIKNFGPIKQGFQDNDGWMDIKKVTVFIGNQGSGKSSVAKLFSTLTWIEKALVRGDLTLNDLTKSNRFMKHCAYQNIGSYFKDNTEINYIGKAYSIDYRSGNLTVEKAVENGYQVPKIMYVPADRNFVSAVKNVRTLKGLPQTLYTFSEEFFEAGENLKGKTLDLPINKAQFEYQSFSKTAWISGEDYKIKLSEASSGFQSFAPLFVVSRYLAQSINEEQDASVVSISMDEEKRIKKEIEKILLNKQLSEEVRKVSLEVLSARFKNSCFVNIVEEPEQNLFPTSQRQVLHSLLEFNNLNEANQLILTTHSPYIINFLSVAIQGDYLKSKVETSEKAASFLERVDKIVPLKSVVAASDVVVYQLDDAGNIMQLPDYEGIPSDANYLNASLGEGNELFGSLLEIEQDYEG
jgi:AAA15 family ATPase/GTPase